MPRTHDFAAIWNEFFQKIRVFYENPRGMGIFNLPRKFAKRLNNQTNFCGL